MSRCSLSAGNYCTCMTHQRPRSAADLYPVPPDSLTQNIADPVTDWLWPNLFRNNSRRKSWLLHWPRIQAGDQRGRVPVTSRQPPCAHKVTLTAVIIFSVVQTSTRQFHPLFLPSGGFISQCFERRHRLHVSVPHGENVMLQEHVGCHAEAGGGASATARSHWLPVTSLISRLFHSLENKLVYGASHSSSFIIVLQYFHALVHWK